MIKTWTLQHFKSVYDLTSLDFRPLTIFAGANSSGKSTLIQSLLLTAQTVQSRVPTRSVILNGHILRLGSFNDILSHGSADKWIEIGFSLSLKMDPRAPESPFQPWNYYMLHGTSLPAESTINCRFRFSAGSGRSDDSLQLQPQLDGTLLQLQAPESPHTTLKVARSPLPNETKRSQLILSESRVLPAQILPLEYDVLEAPGYDHLPRYITIPHNVIPVGAVMDHFLPESLVLRYDAIDEEIRAVLANLTPRGYQRTTTTEDIATVPPVVQALFITLLREAAKGTAGWERLLPDIAALASDFSLEAVRSFYQRTPPAFDRHVAAALESSELEFHAALRNARPPEYSLTYAPLPAPLALARQLLKQYFTQSARYLGPLRDQPKPLYPLAGAAETKDIGLSGEHTAAVLDMHRFTLVEYVPSASFKPGMSVQAPTRAYLIDAVLDWLQYMGIASRIQTSDKGKLGHELKVVPSGSQALRDLTHVGVGVSQVLPILVLCLLADTGATIVLEQPELHLNPRVQTRLADFFLSMTLVSKQCIVETHSEYLINRLRLQAVLAPDTRVSESISVYFVENTADQSHYRQLSINEFGVISDWPQGFFDEGEDLAEAIMRAAMAKRSSQSNG